MNHDEDKIMTFWRWFVKSEKRIKDCIENESSSDREYVVDQLNEHILTIGTLTWDIGLDDSNNWFLTISPNGDKDLFKVTQEIIELAPDHMNWNFHSCKPAKNWDRKFNVYNYDYDPIEVDATPWYYVAFQEEDGSLELILEANNIEYLDSETALSAADAFVLGEIGEELKIRKIHSIAIVHQLEPEFEDTKYPVSELKEHMEE